ncbi:MAG: hypothetical protein SFV53_01125, partial [Rickettsiales bacterium]|nr:hypothetical protein [Rickettsiales bacterium]
MVGGSSNFDDSGNLGFNLGSNLRGQVNPNAKDNAKDNLYVPLITIEGLGLDVSRTTSTDIIASSVKLLATIYGSESNSVTIKTGDDRYDYANKTISSTNPENKSLGSFSPVFAIDVSALAKIQARNIYLIATKQGVGVKMAGEILASDTLNIDANGDIYYKKITANDQAVITSSQNIQTLDANSAISAADISIAAGSLSGEFTNLGKLENANNITIKNSYKFNNFGDVKALNLNLENITNINNSGLLYGQDSLKISGVNLTNNAIDEANSSNSSNPSTIYSRADSSIILTGLLTNSGVISSDKKINLSANQLTNNLDSEISAQDNLTFTIANSLINNGNLLTNNLLTINAKSLTNGSTINNSALIQAKQDSLAFDVNDKITNYGVIQAINNLEIIANSLKNYGAIKSFNETKITAKEITNQENSVIFSKAKADIYANSYLENFGSIIANSTLAIATPQIINHINANILSLSDLKIDFALDSQSLDDQSDLSLINKLENYGKISSQAKLDIKGSSTIYNYNEISSGDILTIYAANLFNGDLQNNDNLDAKIQSNSSLRLYLTNLDNRESIISTADFDIEAVSKITNSGTLKSDNKFTSQSISFTNSNLVKAKNDLNISAIEITNKNTLVKNSAKQDNKTVAVTKITQGLISESGLNHLNANKIDNSSGMIAGAKIKIDYLATINNFNTNNFNAKNLSGIYSQSLIGNDLTSKDLTSQDLTSQDSPVQSYQSAYNLGDYLKVSTQTDFNNDQGSIYSDSSIILDFINDQFYNAGNIEAQSLDITANKIINLGRISASDFIKFNATALDASVADSGKIINGSQDIDNTNVELSAGSYINLTANNNIENYGKITANSNITLTSTLGDINNYYSGIIKNSSTTLTINALNGAFNNKNKTRTDQFGNVTTIGSAQAISNYDLILNVKNLNNDGEIAAANDITTNITNNLNNNKSASIWSGNNMKLNVANILSNSEASIYATKNLTIQKLDEANPDYDPDNNKTNSVQNISGDIQTFAGDIEIDANELNNNRLIKVANKILLEPDSPSNTNMEGWNHYHQHCFGDNCEVWVHLFSNSNYANKNSVAAEIASGRNLTLNLDKLNNETSSIRSSKDLTINFKNEFNNKTINTLIGNFTYEYYTSWRGHGNIYHDDNKGGATINLSDYFVAFPAYIKSGTSLTIKENGADVTQAKLNNDSNIQRFTKESGPDKIDHPITINNIDIYQLSQNGVINVDLSSITDAIAGNNNSDNNANLADKGDIVFSGNFKINLDPSATTPLIESRSQFTDLSKFFGSEYYFNQLGLNGKNVLADIERQFRNQNQNPNPNPNNNNQNGNQNANQNNNNQNLRMLGDAFVENKLIIDQLITLTNDSLFLSKSVTDANLQVKELLDNSVNQFAALGLNAEDVALKGLSKDQVNSLTKDIITFELTNIKGIEVLAPKIYLSQNTRNRLLNPNANTAATSLASSSTIFGNTGLTINSAHSDLTNNGSIRSNGNLNLNIGSLTNKTNSLSQAQITSAANLNITANTGDIKNIGANITSLGSLNLTSRQGNILNTAIVQTNDAALLNSSFGSLGGGDSYQLSPNSSAANPTGNISSTLLQNATIKGGEITINAANDFNNLAANISTTKNILNQDNNQTTSGNLSIIAGDDVNIATLQLHNHSESHWGRKKNGGDIVKDSVTNIQSNLNIAGNLNSGSVNDTTLQAANISVGTKDDNTSGNTDINSGGNILLLTAQDSSFESSSIRKNGTFTFKNTDKGHNDTTIINNQISSTNSMNLTADNAAYVEYKSGTNTSQNIQDQLASIKANSTLTNPISEMHKSWDQTSRGLNQTGTLTIAVTGAALTGGLGSFGTFGMAALSAGIGTAGTIAATSAANTAIDGGNLGSTLKQAVKDTTSKQSLEQIAISAAAAGIATGASNAAGLSNTANAANTVSAGERIIANVGTALAKSSIYAASNIVATSAIKGQSISDLIKDNGGVKQIILTSLASSIAETGAKEIGRAAHGTTTTLTDSSGNPLRNLDGTTMTTSQINQPTQLALHGVLGATTSKLLGGDALSGAAAGVLGELAADSAYQEGSGSFNRQQAIAIGQAAGAAAALLTSSTQGKSDEQTATNVGVGGFVGGNAA